MGGNALKKVENVRLDKDEFEDAKFFVTSYLESIGVKNDVPPSYSSKSSFGDLDILVLNKGDMKDTIQKINEKFKPVDSFLNSTVYSFALEYNFKYFQVDLIFVTEKDYNMSLNYLSYNDLFNLLGRLAHKLGLKLGHNGLSVVVKNGDYLVENIVLTRDLKEIFRIIDVDYDRYLQGFETPEDIFDFVTSSKYFDADSFKLENLNNINRVRNAKRKIYMEFIKYVDGKEFENKVQVQRENREVFVSTLLEKFPEAKAELQEAKRILKMRQDASAVFNGNIVKELLDIDNKELGEFMKNFKNKYSTEFLSTKTKEEVEDLILGF